MKFGSAILAFTASVLFSGTAAKDTADVSAEIASQATTSFLGFKISNTARDGEGTKVDESKKENVEKAEITSTFEDDVNGFLMEVTATGSDDMEEDDTGKKDSRVINPGGGKEEDLVVGSPRGAGGLLSKDSARSKLVTEVLSARRRADVVKIAAARRKGEQFVTLSNHKVVELAPRTAKTKDELLAKWRKRIIVAEGRDDVDPEPQSSEINSDSTSSANDDKKMKNEDDNVNNENNDGNDGNSDANGVDEDNDDDDDEDTDAESSDEEAGDDGSVSTLFKDLRFSRVRLLFVPEGNKTMSRSRQRSRNSPERIEPAFMFEPGENTNPMSVIPELGRAAFQKYIDCRCEFPGELIYNITKSTSKNKRVRKWKKKKQSKYKLDLLLLSHEPEDCCGDLLIVNETIVLPPVHPACVNVTYICPGQTVNAPKWNYRCTRKDCRFDNYNSISNQKNGKRTDGKFSNVRRPRKPNRPSRDLGTAIDGHNAGVTVLTKTSPAQLTGTEDDTRQLTYKKFIKKKKVNKFKNINKSGYVVMLPADHPSCNSGPSFSDLSTVPSFVPVVPSENPSDPPVSSDVPSANPNEVIGSITGSVFQDLDNDDSGDHPLANVVIKLLDASNGNDILATTLTAADGTYSFTQVPTGTYAVMETNPATFLDVSDVDGGDANMITVVLGSDNPIHSVGNDFVDEPSRTISGIVLEDTDNDGNGDSVLSGVGLVLIDSSGNPVATTVTDSTGTFSFDNIPPDVYTLVETNRDDLTDVIDSDGDDPNVISVDVTGGDSMSNFFVDERRSGQPSISSSPTALVLPSPPPSLSSLPSAFPISYVASASPSSSPSDTETNIPSIPIVPTENPSNPPSGTSPGPIGPGTPSSPVLNNILTNPSTVPSFMPSLRCNLDYNTCLISGDPDENEPTAGCPAATPLPGCDGSQQTWSASMFFYEYDEVNDETFIAYNVTQPGGGVVEHVTINWNGNCCVRDASFTSLNLEFGLDTSTCMYGVKYDSAFLSFQTSSFYKITYAGNARIVPNAATVAIKAANGYCKYKLPGPDCSQCRNSISSATPSIATTSPPQDSPTVSASPTIINVPSLAPSLSSSPSESSSVSGQPSRPPVESPSGSVQPSDIPSLSPSNSKGPSNSPSEENGAPSVTSSSLPSSVPSRSCKDLVIDFETAGDGSSLTAGDYITMPWFEEYGITVTALSTNGGFTPFGRPRLFDTMNPGTNNDNGDPDLGSPNAMCTSPGPGVGAGGIPGSSGENCSPLGLVLIIQESNKLDPDDNAKGGMIQFDFSSPADEVFAIGLMDIEAGNTPTTVDVKTSDATIRTYEAAGLGDNSVQRIVINQLSVVQVKVNFGASGAVTELSLCVDQLQTPPSLPETFVPSQRPTQSQRPSQLHSSTPSQTLLGSISGNVQEDSNNDDFGDFNLADVPIKLLDISSAVVATTLTDSAGNYGFYDLPIGSYFVMETNLPGYLDVSDTDGIDLNMISAMVGGPSPLNSTGNDFVDELSRTVAGTVSEDTDMNGIGDVGIPVVTLSLVDSSGNTVATTVTDSSGAFGFEGVPPGVYTVVETNNSGFVDVTDSDLGDPNVITVDLTSGDSPVITFVDERPSSAPSVSASPTIPTEPSGMPTFSSIPSSSPSSNPTGSISPSILPSGLPTSSVKPSLAPSGTPSLSNTPTDRTEQSILPSFRPSPSSSPSLGPTQSRQPSRPPSISAHPSPNPSRSPSIS